MQNAEASDEDEEGTALVITPGPSSAKEEKENEAFFKKVRCYRRKQDANKSLVLPESL